MPNAHTINWLYDYSKKPHFQLLPWLIWKRVFTKKECLLNKKQKMALEYEFFIKTHRVEVFASKTEVIVKANNHCI